MKKWAEILAGKVRHIFDAEDDFTPEFDPAVLSVVEITGADPMPAEGWGYSTDGGFTAHTPGNTVYVDISISGGDGMVPIGILNDGVSALNVAIKLLDAPGGNVLSAMPTDTFRMPLRGADGGVYDMVGITIMAGEANVSYTTTAKPDLVTFTQQDVGTSTVGGVEYQTVLLTPLEFRVYRAL